jgi:membrane-associated phospholipid phosphatase
MVKHRRVGLLTQDEAVIERSARPGDGTRVADSTWMPSPNKLFLILSVYTACLAPQVRAQDAPPSSELTLPPPSWQVVGQPAGPPPTPRHTGIKAMLKGLATDVEHLPSRENLFWVGVGSGLSLAVHPADDSVNQHLVGSAFADKVFTPGAIIGGLPTLLGTAATVYAVGRFKDEPKVSHLGMDLIRALLIAEGLTQGLKYTVRRERPDQSGRSSFPSGHAADTFAFATALERHLGWRGAVPAYIFSSYVAASRLHDNRHFLSDVVFGATVGIISGRTVTRQGHAPYPVDIALLPGGAAVLFSKRHHD